VIDLPGVGTAHADSVDGIGELAVDLVSAMPHTALHDVQVQTRIVRFGPSGEISAAPELDGPAFRVHVLATHAALLHSEACSVAAQRLLALTAAIWHNRVTGQPVTRSLIAYDH
jgi:hypothetical protein